MDPHNYVGMSLYSDDFGITHWDSFWEITQPVIHYRVYRGTGMLIGLILGLTKVTNITITTSSIAT